MQRYRASIVIPLLSQRDEWLEQCILSAVEQTVPTEVLVITAPQTKASNRAVLEEAGRRYQSLRLLERPPGARFAGAINHGFLNAAIERVGLLLSDDWLAPDAVERCLEQSADIVASGRTAYAANGIETLWERIPNADRFGQLATLEEKASYLSHFLFFRRDCFFDAGGVDPDVGHTGPDDYDLIWTLFEHGASVAVIERSLYRYRDHCDQRLTLRKREDQIRDLVKIFTKHGIIGVERDRLIEKKKKWYGEPCYQVLQQIAKET